MSNLLNCLNGEGPRQFAAPGVPDGALGPAPRAQHVGGRLFEPRGGRGHSAARSQSLERAVGHGEADGRFCEARITECRAQLLASTNT